MHQRPDKQIGSFPTSQSEQVSASCWTKSNSYFYQQILDCYQCVRYAGNARSCQVEEIHHSSATIGSVWNTRNRRTYPPCHDSHLGYKTSINSYLIHGPAYAYMRSTYRKRYHQCTEITRGKSKPDKTMQCYRSCRQKRTYCCWCVDIVSSANARRCINVECASAIAQCGIVIIAETTFVLTTSHASLSSLPPNLQSKYFRPFRPSHLQRI